VTKGFGGTLNVRIFAALFGSIASMKVKEMGG